MKEKDTSDSGNLIQKARQALEKGDQRTAHDFAMAATTDPSQEEQAWLILASLSEPHQALQYLENALKANPRSQAARKAVRLVYSQMAAQEGSQPETPIAPPIKPLEDTAPIPVLDEAPEVDLSAEGYITEELIQMEHESVAAASDQESHASQDATRPPTHERMADLRKKLSRPATQEEVIEAGEEETTQKKKLHLRHKAPVLNYEGDHERHETDSEPEDHEKHEIHEQEMEKETEDAHVEVSEEEQPTKSEEEVDIQAIEAAVVPPEKEGREGPPVETPSTPTNERGKRKKKTLKVEKPSMAAPPEAKPEEKLEEKPVVEIVRKKSGRKVAISKPEQTLNYKKESIKSNHLSGKRESTNVDTIELILVSMAAILLPLLVFLYFYLTK